MNRRNGLYLCILVMALGAHAPRAAASFDWEPVTDAEKALKASPLDPGAGSVVLFKRGQIDVLEATSSLWTTHTQTYVRIKILNDAGRDAANVALETYKFARVAKVEGRTILPSGEVIPLDSSKIFRGTSAIEGRHFTIQQTSFTFPSVETGAIVEYQIDESQDWYYPQPWIFNNGRLGTLDSTLRVVIGPRLGMTQYPLGTNENQISASQKETAKGAQYDFSVKNLRALQQEPFAAAYRDLCTMVMFVPTERVFSGRLFPIIKTWDDLATIVTRELGRMEDSSGEAKSKAKEIAEKISDPRQKAEAIYKYLQQNIVSTNLVGSYMGRAADEILKAKRGDPDEINALYVVMLREVKVDSSLVLVATRNWQTLVAKYPNYAQFSRIIARLNLKSGAVFADPADAACQFADLPWFDRGIEGMVVDGSKMKEETIPMGEVDSNVSTAEATMRIDKDWSAEGEEKIQLAGGRAIDNRTDLMTEAPEKLETTLTNIMARGKTEAEITQIQHPDFQDSSAPLVLQAHVREKLNSEAGPGEMLLNPWVYHPYQHPSFKAMARMSPVRFRYPEKHLMTTTWQLPPEIKVEQLPKEVKVENDLGGFAHSCSQDGATVTCKRSYYLKKVNLVTNVEYLNAKQFFDDIAKYDQEVVVLHEEK